ncbi:MAG: hypothetical protein ACR2PZ_21990 [Pseudomonadales bacterium]
MPKPRPAPIPRAIVGNVSVSEQGERQVASLFRGLIDSGYALKLDGAPQADAETVLRSGYTPKYLIELFGTRFFTCKLRDVDGIKVIPAYVVPAKGVQRNPAIHARAFYKDSSLVWRAASHLINEEGDRWIGKGAVKWVNKRGERGWYSAEETTNLPFELQAALDTVGRSHGRRGSDHRVLSLFLRNAPAGRVEPYLDFSGPRERAMALPANRVNRRRPVAWFEDDHEPGSLRFAEGFAPDFRKVIDVSGAVSRMYGGDIQKIRIASANELIQYLFVVAPKHIWLVHAQTFTTELSSYGLRTVDVMADEELFIPGYEFFDHAGEGEADDQIPAGFAGEICPGDPDRADASPWNDKLPVVKAIRRQLRDTDWPVKAMLRNPAKS